MNIRLRSILILFLAVSGTIFGQLPALYFHEITGNTHGGSPTSPIYDRETLSGLTNMASEQDYFYATTLPNAHIYKIQLSTNSIIDYGPAGADSIYDLKSGPLITNDGQYILGCTSLRPSVFYMDHTQSNPIILSLGHTKFMNDDIRGLNSPTYFRLNNNSDKCVYMGMGSGDNIARILKWDFTATLNGNQAAALSYINCYDIDLLGQIHGGTDNVAIGHCVNGKDIDVPALYVGIQDAALTDYIGVYDLQNNGWIKFINVKTLTYNNNNNNTLINTSSFHFVVNGDQIFLFKQDVDANGEFLGTGSVYKLDAETVNETKTASASSVISDWTYGNVKMYYKVENNFIYTQRCRIDCSTLQVLYYTGSTTRLDSRNILLNNTMIFGAYSPESDLAKVVFKFNKSDGSGGSWEYRSEPTPKTISPVGGLGGNYIGGLAVGNNQIYASLFWNGIELRGTATNPAWGVYSVGLSQADQICAVDQFRLYGLYSMPILRVYYAYTFADINLQDLIIHDKRQVRITKILPIGEKDGYRRFLLGTGTSESESNTSARILLLRLKINGPVPSLESYVDEVAELTQSSSVGDLACYQLSEDKLHPVNIRVFFTDGERPGVFDYSGDPACVLLLQANHYNTWSLLKVGDKLFTSSTGINGHGGTAQHLWVYNLTGANAITSTYDFYNENAGNPNCGTLYRNIDTYTPDVNHRVVDQFTNQPLGGLTLGNGTYPLVYCSHDGDLLYFNPNNIGTEGNYYIGRIRIPEYTSSHYPGYEITNLATDKLLSTNQSVYVSTRMGRLYYVDNIAGQGNNENAKKSSKKSNYEFNLNQNYPNPFNPVTNISYSVSEKNVVQIKVFDVLGRQVTTLVNEEKEPGEYNIQFNGKSLSSGVYYYQLQSGSRITSKKFILLK